MVEDDQRVRDLIRTVLELFGYTVLGALAGTDALRIADEHPGAIALVVTDVAMYQLGGRPLADHLARIRAGTRVLLCPATRTKSSVSTAFRGPEPRFSGCLSRPRSSCTGSAISCPRRPTRDRTGTGG